MRAEQEFFTLEDTVALIMRHKLLFCSVLMTMMITSTGLAFWLDRIYRAETLLIPAEEAGGQDGASMLGALGGLGSLAGLAGLSPASQNHSFEHMAVLTSYSFLTAFVEDEQLMIELFHSDWDEARGRWKNDPPEAWDAYQLLIDDVIDLEQDDTTGLLELRVEWRDPELAASWSNTLIDRLNEQTRARAIAEAEKSIAYLRTELDKTSVVGIQQGINDLIQEQINQIMLANVREEFAFRVIDPAVPPPADEYVRPIRWLFALAGAILGLVVGSFAVGVRARFETD